MSQQLRVLISLFLAASQAAVPARPGPSAATPFVVAEGMHHLRSGGDLTGATREWASFPPQAEAGALVVTFDAHRNPREQVLRLRHRDLKELWTIRINDREIARLPQDEADMLTYWAVPPGTLREGGNELRIGSASKTADDVSIGEVTILDHPRAEALSEASVDVTIIEDPGGRPVPGRITVTDARGTLVSFGNASDADRAVRPGVVYTRAGAARLALPAGRYVIYAGRGFEYSVATARIDLARGAAIARRLAIRREVDTTGWAAMDTHIHTGEVARHGDATIAERLMTLAGEGIELPVSTEHNVRVDFDARARSAGLRDRFSPIAGTEVTTPSLGHFNVFPIPAPAGGNDSSAAGTSPSATRIDEKLGDWPGLGAAIRQAAGDPVVVLNHGRDDHGGFRPLGAARHISIAGEDLEGLEIPANAMEVVNSGAILSDGLALPRDWMGLLNRGRLLTPVGSSDSHDVSRYIVGQGRTYVRCDDSRPGGIDPGQAVESVRRGRVAVSYGLMTGIEVAGRGPGELVAARGDLDVRIRVQGPDWTRAERVALYVDGEKVRDEAVAHGARGGVKWDRTWRIAKPAHDVHLVAIATGPGVAAPYWPTAKPYQPASIEFTPYVLGVSGAVFVDADGDGRFRSALEYARREVEAARGDLPRLARALGPYDAAVAIQAASLVRAARGQDPAGFERAIRAMAAGAPPQVVSGVMAYLDAWKAAARAAAH